MKGIERHVPSAAEAIAFRLKTHVLQGRRMLIDWDQPMIRHPKAVARAAQKVVAEKRAPLWRDIAAQEFPLTAGKVENLRLAAKILHDIEVPAGAVWSFWKQLGKTSQSKGFVQGRELREGCLVPAVGGGLCQLSGLIYQAALKAGLEVVERHGHSRIVPGSQAEHDLDATVFWNYVDLRLRSDASWRMEVQLDASDLIVRIRSGLDPAPSAAMPEKREKRAAPSGDCLTCGMTECFRHPAALSKHAPSMGHSAYLLDTRWPEFNEWCAEHSREGDRWYLPMNGERWRKPNYSWSVPGGIRFHHATVQTLWRSFRQRTLPAQGAERQQGLLSGSEALARSYARMLSPQCRHLVVSQNLLPYLWRDGVLGGRSFDVLMERWPMA